MPSPSGRGPTFPRGETRSWDEKRRIHLFKFEPMRPHAVVEHPSPFRASPLKPRESAPPLQRSPPPLSRGMARVPDEIFGWIDDLDVDVQRIEGALFDQRCNKPWLKNILATVRERCLDRKQQSNQKIVARWFHVWHGLAMNDKLQTHYVVHYLRKQYFVVNTTARGAKIKIFNKLQLKLKSRLYAATHQILTIKSPNPQHNKTRLSCPSKGSPSQQNKLAKLSTSSSKQSYHCAMKSSPDSASLVIATKCEYRNKSGTDHLRMYAATPHNQTRKQPTNQP
ncbi:hypothetical protein DFJ77DRAFT_459846, partial [Powellomyces hirtus]